MRRLASLAFIFSAVFMLAMSESAARAASAPEPTIRDFYQALLRTMQHGPELGRKGRYDALAPEIRRSFDLPSMARMAVGPSWARFSPEEQEGVTEAFARYTIATYASRFDAFSGEKFDVTGQRRLPLGTVVESLIMRPGSEPVRIDYLMRQNGNDWQIADVYLTGAVSQLATLRAQFTAVLAQRGVAGLIDTLNRKAAALTASASAS
jgi:phospholipid transport system substrate-binding protein